MLKHTFLGHQTWLVTNGTSTLLIDPVLEKGFGNSAHINFEVYPPRHIKTNEMPHPDAIILSHEHVDHFHIASLNLIPRSVPVYTGPLMPECITHALLEMGFKVIEAEFHHPIKIGELEFTLYSPDTKTIFWEKRVVQIYIKDCIDEISSFIAVDALVSSAILDDINSKKIIPPRLVVVSNNSMISPVGASQGVSKLNGSTFAKSAGIGLLTELISENIKYFGDSIDIVLCGDGHVDHSHEFGPFLYSDHRELAKIANSLCLRNIVHGPYPGESINIHKNMISTSTESWIFLDEERHNFLKQKQLTFLKSPSTKNPDPVIKLVYDDESLLRDVSTIENYLPELARLLILTECGIGAVSIIKENWKPLGKHRVLLRLLLGDGRAVQYALNFKNARFEPDYTTPDQILNKFPYGIEIFLADFAAILRAELQIWDIMGRATRSWFIGGDMCGVEPLLLRDLGEQIRPDLHEKFFMHAIERLRMN